MLFKRFIWISCFNIFNGILVFFAERPSLQQPDPISGFGGDNSTTTTRTSVVSKPTEDGGSYTEETTVYSSSSGAPGVYAIKLFTERCFTRVGSGLTRKHLTLGWVSISGLSLGLVGEKEQDKFQQFLFHFVGGRGGLSSSRTFTSSSTSSSSRTGGFEMPIHISIAGSEGADILKPKTPRVRTLPFSFADPFATSPLKMTRDQPYKTFFSCKVLHLGRLRPYSEIVGREKCANLFSSLSLTKKNVAWHRI